MVFYILCLDKCIEIIERRNFCSVKTILVLFSDALTIEITIYVCTKIYIFK